MILEGALLTEAQIATLGPEGTYPLASFPPFSPTTTASSSPSDCPI